MRLSCPSCAAVYEIPDEKLGPGPRLLRCARCGEEWTHPAPSPSAPEPPPPSPPPHSPAPPERITPTLTIPTVEGSPERGLRPAPQRPPRPPPRPMRDLTQPESPPATATVWLGWLASIVVLAVLIWAGYIYRNDVMQAWPPSQRLYATLGLSPPPAAADKSTPKTP